MTQPTIAQLHNLTDRAGAGLTPDEQARLRAGVDRLEQAEAVVGRVRASLASFDGRGVLAIGHVNLDVPTAGEVLTAVRAALDGEQPGPAATQATEPAGLRARIAHTLRTTPNRHATNQLGFPDHHGPSEGYLGWCALCTRDVDALTEALLAAVNPERPGPG